MTWQGARGGPANRISTRKAIEEGEMRKIRMMLAAALATGVIVMAVPSPAPASGAVCIDLQILGNDPDPICIPIP